MHLKTFNLQSALIELSHALLDKSVVRKTRGNVCYEFPEPVTVTIQNPTDRYINIPERKWNKFLPWAESAWLASGSNDLNTLPGQYVKNLYNFTDNGRTWRAGYGPRIRGFNGLQDDYDVVDSSQLQIFPTRPGHTDQLAYVIDMLKKDIQTRQAIISIGDPVKDNYDLTTGEIKQTKDYPCTREIHFMVVDGRLDCYVHIRSNDLIWGFSAVNVFNFTLMQEYVAGIVGVPVGAYHHMVDNLHVYGDFLPLVRKFADYPIEPPMARFTYKIPYTTLEEFDKSLQKLLAVESCIRTWQCTLAQIDEVFTHDQLMHDWARVFYLKWHPRAKVHFNNPLLNKLFYEDSRT